MTLVPGPVADHKIWYMTPESGAASGFAASLFLIV